MTGLSLSMNSLPGFRFMTTSLIARRSENIECFSSPRNLLRVRLWTGHDNDSIWLLQYIGLYWFCLIRTFFSQINHPEWFISRKHTWMCIVVVSCISIPRQGPWWTNSSVIHKKLARSYYNSCSLNLDLAEEAAKRRIQESISAITVDFWYSVTPLLNRVLKLVVWGLTGVFVCSTTESDRTRRVFP